MSFSFYLNFVIVYVAKLLVNDIWPISELLSRSIGFACFFGNFDIRYLANFILGS
jgi:hypothetical protein